MKRETGDGVAVQDLGRQKYCGPGVRERVPSFRSTGTGGNVHRQGASRCMHMISSSTRSKEEGEMLALRQGEERPRKSECHGHAPVMCPCPQSSHTQLTREDAGRWVGSGECSCEGSQL